MTNLYEAMFLLDNREVKKGFDAARERVTTLLTKHGAKPRVVRKWDERKLAYEIKAQKRGLYIIAYFNAPGPAVSAIERDVNLSEDILRVMVTDAEHMNKDEMAAVEPQPIVPKEDRAPWDRPGFNDDGRRPRRDDRDRDRDRDRAPREGDRAPREEKPEAAASAKE